MIILKDTSDDSIKDVLKAIIDIRQLATPKKLLNLIVVNDPMKQERRKALNLIGEVCPKIVGLSASNAAMGHPNPSGAKAYSRAITDVIIEKVRKKQ